MPGRSEYDERKVGRAGRWQSAISVWMLRVNLILDFEQGM